MICDYRIACAYDTETCNIEVDGEWLAYPVLFIFNDLRVVDLESYEPDDSTVEFARTFDEAIVYIDRLIDDGRRGGYIPIVCAYNLMFDLQPIIYELNLRYDIEASAQSSTHAYTVDLVDDEGKTVLRFWDTYYLEMRGLAAMGRTCGIEKAVGDWNYSLTRTQETPLGADELHYAARDVEVIPAYLRYLLESNEWLQPWMLGVRVLTKTSLVRMAGRLETGRLRYSRRGCSPISVQKQFAELCASEIAPDYDSYALRKCCFRGGLTFTAANFAMQVQRRVYSLDVTSMHHAYINGHMVPVRFAPASVEVLALYARRVLCAPIDSVLSHWEEPFCCAFHAAFRFEGLRLRRNSAFAAWGIATIAEGKFKTVSLKGEWGGEADNVAEDAVRRRYHDMARGAVMAFGKLMSADIAVLHLTEIELWTISRVYEWDDMRPLYGEATGAFVKPPDYVTLLSNLLFERKQALKEILKGYREGEPYMGDIHQSVPEHIAGEVRAGRMSRSDLEGYYTSTVKGQFNSIYGTQAQDVFKPDYVCDDGELSVNASTTVKPETYGEALEDKRKSLVLYTYGMRIAGGSRMELVCAIEMLHAALGNRVRVLGGDTDSLKVSAIACTVDDIQRALEPLHIAVTRAIDACMQRVRSRYPDYASTLDEVGCFEVENPDAPYVEHMEAWNKARVSWDGEHAHITCAGLSRPRDAYNIEKFIDDIIAGGHGFSEVAPLVLGFGVEVAEPVSHGIEHARPHPWERVELDVTDYRGETAHVSSYRSIALYPASRVLGDLEQGVNLRSLEYLESIGVEVETRRRMIDVRDGKPELLICDDGMWGDAL